MRYSDFVEVYESLFDTTKKLEKVEILAKFLHKLRGCEEWVYLLRGRVLPDYDSREFGMSTQLVIKAIAKASGSNVEHVTSLQNKIGDLGDVADKLLHARRQHTLFSKALTTDFVFNNLKKIMEFEGKGAVEKKINLVVELLNSANGKEAKYIIRTVLNDLRVGVADALLRDAIVKAHYPGDDAMKEKIEEAFDLNNDFALILNMAEKGKSAFKNIVLVTGRPVKVMLPVKVTNLEEAFRICGKPAAIEHKYDGFRVVVSKQGKDVKLFTRRLEEVTKQFPDIVKAVLSNVHAESCIIDSEAVGYNEKKKYMPFEAISQRIKRKYDIEKIIHKLPVELNVFDILYYNNKSVIEMPFFERRKLLEKIIKSEKWKIKLSTQYVSDDLKQVEKFYKQALKEGEEGIMIKNLNAVYKPGRLVGYMVKLKPEVRDLDLVIVGAEYGTGKRAGGLTSFIVACKDGKEFLEVGKVSSGLKEKESEGTSYGEINKLLQPLIVKEEGNSVRVKPHVVVSVTYQNIQKSPSYSSGFAMRFPRITHYRPERGLYDIATIEDIKKESNHKQYRADKLG